MDFSIEHYTVRELIQILDIPDTQSIYDKETFKEAIERTIVCIDDTDNEKIIEDIIVFLVNAYQKMCNFYKLPLSKEELQFFIRDITNLSIHTKKKKKEEKDILTVPYDMNEDYDIETEASRLIIPRKEAYIPNKEKKQIKPIEKIRPSPKQIFKKKIVKKMYVFNSKFRKTNKSNNLIEKRTLLDNTTLITDPNDTQISYSLDDTRSRRHFLVSRTEVTNSSTNFEIRLDTPLTNVTEIQFKSMELLNSYYTINNNNNIFFIQPQFYEDDLLTGDLSSCGLTSNEQLPYIKISIPSGNYFGDSTFDDNIKNKIEEDIININNYSKIEGDDAVDTSLNILFNLIQNISVGVAKDSDTTKSTNRMVFNFASPPSLNVDMSINMYFTSEEISPNSNKPNTNSFLPIYNNIGYILGFRKIKYTGALTYIAESLFESQGTRNIYFYLEDDANSTSQIDNFEIMMPDGTYLSENILAKIPNYASTYNIQYETDADNIYRIRKYTSPVKINNLKVKLLDDQGNIIDNNNTDFTFTLEVTSDPNNAIE